MQACKEWDQLFRCVTILGEAAARYRVVYVLGQQQENQKMKRFLHVLLGAITETNRWTPVGVEIEPTFRSSPSLET
jgi:Tfp pilus assembly protein PilW